VSRGRLEAPDLDDRTWQDLVDEARALIPRYAPEWTDHNPSDPGMALVELFAYLVEGLIYRLNRVPEKNLLRFLDLVGVRRAPAQPAMAQLVYRIDRTLEELVVPAGSQAATRQTETEDAVVFQTDEDLRVLPLDLTHALLVTLADAPRYRDVSDRVVRPPLGSLDVALAAGEDAVLVLGFDAATSAPLPLRVRLLQPAQESGPSITWVYSAGDLSPQEWPALAGDRVADPSGGLREHTTVTVRVPADWRAQDPGAWGIPPLPGIVPLDRERFWLGVRIANQTARPAVLGIGSVLANSVRATAALTTRDPEVLGRSTGEPFQSFELRQRPVYPEPVALDPYGHLRIQVREAVPGGGFKPWTDWRRVAEFPAGDARAYRLDPVAGTVDLGGFRATDRDPDNGRIPPAGSEIRALPYRYVAHGAGANVAAGVVTEIRTAQQGLTGVVNPGPGEGGADEEPVDEAVRRGPEALQRNRRAVTVADYEHLAKEASDEVRKARALPPLADGAAAGGLVRTPGHVVVVIVPAAPPEAPRPMPTAALIQRVTAHLDERRCLTADVEVTHPRYLPIDVTVQLRVWTSAVAAGLTPSAEAYGEVVRGRIDAFLHPVCGGVDGIGWEIGQDATISALFDAIRPPSDIGFIADISIRPGRGDLQRATDEGRAWVQVADHELVCSGTHTVNALPVDGG
jgi:uncharacterized phage protein gp47/JayE